MLARLLTQAFTVVVLATTAASAASPFAKIAPGLAEQVVVEQRTEVVVAISSTDSGPPTPGQLRQRIGRIAQRQAAVISAVVTRSGADNIAIHHRFATAHGFTASVTPAGLAALAAQPGISAVAPMAEGTTALADSVPQIGADIVRTFGVDGRGVTVAVLDTAIDTTHPDIAGRIVAEECFCTSGCCPGNVNRLSGPGSATGRAANHGTHVTGIIVSQGNNRRAPIGVAPGASVVAIRVLDDRARGALGDWIAALDWLAINRPDVRAVNMSLVTDTLFPVNCEPLSVFNHLFREVIDTLRAQGTLVFAAAGNSGDTTMIAAPACVATAVAVGAVDKSDVVADFSNSSVALDLLAPGVSIRSAAPNNTTTVLSGTSMATPHAVATAALVWNIDPDLTPDAVESYLRQTGVPILDARNGRKRRRRMVFPRIDALAAFEAVQRDGALTRGGGSRLTDCLVEWVFVPATVRRSRARPIAFCHDGDAACDQDQVSGQCTFSFSLCFNVPDGRIAHCRTNDPITKLTLVTPLRDTIDPIETGNAAAVSAVLPATPLNGTKVCTDLITVEVPVDHERQGGRTIRLTAESFDRRDSDRARLVCLPAS